MAIGDSTVEEVVNTDFWRGRRVFVTGHTGFKGSWLCLWLQSMGAEVTGYALPPEDPALFAEAQLGDGMRSHFGDISHLARLAGALSEADPEIVFHLAAQALVRRSYANPVETYATNVLGTVHLLEAVRRGGGVRAVVNVTSDKCYENREWVWGYRESDELGGRDPYSSSKAAAELVTRSYRASFLRPAGIAVATARAGNSIGGGDWAPDRLIPDVIRARGRSVEVRNPGAVRPWQHVLEPLAGYLLLAEALSADGDRFASAWNFGPDPGNVQSVSAVVDGLLSRLPGSARWQHDSEPHPPEAHCLRLDSTKARTELGWRPRWNLDQSLDAVAEWYRARENGGDMREVTLGQIAAYSAAPALSPCVA